MNYTITLTYMELIDIAGLLRTHVELCKDLAQEAEASVYQTILDKIRSRIAGHPDPEEVHLTEEELRYCRHDVLGLCEAMQAQMARDGDTHAPDDQLPDSIYVTNSMSASQYHTPTRQMIYPMIE